MLEYFRPAEYVGSIYNVDYAALKQKGIRNILMDLDDTLLPREMLDITPVLFTFIEGLKDKGFRIFLLSNSMHPVRVEYVAKTFDLPYSTLSGKPLPFAFRRALEGLQAEPKDCVIIGDQLFMDILGGNLLGIHTILVRPMTKEKFWLRRLMRLAEKWVLQQLKLEP